MKTVYILGAGASYFAGFPLAIGLLGFLEPEVGNADLLTEQQGRVSFQALKAVIDYLRTPGSGTGPPDLELIFTIMDFANIQGGVLGSLDLTQFDLQDVQRGFARLISSAFP